MTPQIFGTKSCKETQKAIRFCKERGIVHQFIDLTQKEPSKKELAAFLQKYSLEELINEDGRAYKDGGYAYLEVDWERELREKPLLLNTPLIRADGGVCIGADPKELKGVLCS